MMQVIPKWRVTVSFQSKDPVVFWVYDNFASNVLRKIADMEFSHPVKGFDSPTGIQVGLEIDPKLEAKRDDA